MPGPAGRFAPSPTGPLHLGSLTTALASWLDARSLGDQWFVRLDDLDRERNQPGAEVAILQALEAHSLHWDGGVQHQSDRVDHYAAALETLGQQSLLFWCTCSRRMLEGHARYPGLCREYTRPRPDAAVRAKVPEAPVGFVDLRLGKVSARLDGTVGDFVVWRRDGIAAYPLATAVDDGDPAVTRVIRGRDLLDQTPAQIWLMARLGLPVPRYAHLPLVTNRFGQKLAKQTHAPALDLTRPAANLRFCLAVLGLTAPIDIADPAELVRWAVGRWSIDLLPAGDAVL
jgi:glutamyl-Q tRNA(Asp) synthetase